MKAFPTIDLNKLRYFYVATRLRSFSKAAAQLKVSQSAVSQAVSALERFFGRSLLHRQKRTFRLTPYGRRLYDHANGLFHLADEMTRDVFTHEKTIELGLDEWSILTLFPEIRQKGEYQLNCHRPQRLREMVLDGEVDLAFFYEARKSTISDKCGKEVLIGQENLAVLAPQKARDDTIFIPHNLQTYIDKVPKSLVCSLVHGSEIAPLNLAQSIGARVLAPVSLAQRFALKVERELKGAKLWRKAFHCGENCSSPLEELIQAFQAPVMD